uniref:Uncharacterized protein n=1 Tax=Cucumis melo TaxID=3656 RepID=A0A9I9E7M6_CUCME
MGRSQSLSPQEWRSQSRYTLFDLVTLSEQSRINKVARAKQPYNHSNKSKSFLQQHELTKQQGNWHLDSHEVDI